MRNRKIESKENLVMRFQAPPFAVRSLVAIVLLSCASLAAAGRPETRCYWCPGLIIQDRTGDSLDLDFHSLIVSQSESAGVVDAGEHSYVLTFVTLAGETRAGNPVALMLTNSKHRVDITNLPTGSDSVIARRLYRSKANDPKSGRYFLLTTFNDNSTANYTDDTPDSGLQGLTYVERSTAESATPAQRATPLSVDQQLLNRGDVAVVKEPRPGPFTATPGKAGNVDVGQHEYSVTFVTATGETEGSVSGYDIHSPSAAGVPVTIGGSSRQVVLTSIPVGSSLVTARRIWRSKSQAPKTETEKYFLVATIPDNSTTTFTDNVPDSKLGAEGRLLHNNSTAAVLKVGTTPSGFIGELNTVLGFNTQPASSIGEVNTVFGARSAINNVGDGNSFFGYEAGLGQTTGLLNTGVGLQALSKNGAGSGNTAIGGEALMHAGENSSPASGSTAVGHAALFLPRISVDNVAIGENALRGELSSTGSENVAIGVSALRSFSNGSHNTAIGWSVFGNLTTGANNVGVGFQAGNYAIGASRNTLVGTNAGRGAVTGFSGSDNTVVGMEAGAGFTTAGSNSLFGFSSGNAITTGAQNSALGLQSLNRTTSGSNNVAVGTNAGINNIAGENNTLVGAGADLGAGNLKRATALGAGAIVNQSDSLVLGNNVAVGIGTSAPKARLEVTGGHILLGTPGEGIVLKSPDGAMCKLLALDNSGALNVSAIRCP